MLCPRCQRRAGACGCEAAPILLDRLIDLERGLVPQAPHPSRPLDLGEPPAARPALGGRGLPFRMPRRSAAEVPERLRAERPRILLPEVPQAATSVAERTPARPAAEAAARLSDVPLWRRAAAWTVDSALVLAAAAPPLVAAAYGLPPGARALDALGPPGLAFVLLLAFVYSLLAHAVLGGTLGKRLLRLRVSGPGGRPPTLARSAGRAALAVLGCVPLGAGVLAAVFTRGGRGLHDLALGTAVVPDGPSSS